MRDKKKVTVKGVTWVVLSRNGRTCQINGRYFIAMRGGPKRLWSLIEYDGDIMLAGVTEVGYNRFRLLTSMLSQAVIHIVQTGEVLPTRGFGQPMSEGPVSPTLEYSKALEAVSL